jgi:hypothetical protein
VATALTRESSNSRPRRRPRTVAIVRALPHDAFSGAAFPDAVLGAAAARAGLRGQRLRTRRYLLPGPPAPRQFKALANIERRFIFA